jgi:FlaA1/EpsC-like NDP-sugar epimerase
MPEGRLDIEVGVTAAPVLGMRRILVVGVHVLLIPVAYHAAVRLLAGTPLPADAAELFARTAPLVLVLRMVAFGWFRLFDGWWSNAGMHDLTDLVKAITASTFLMALYFVAVGGVGSLPGALLVVDWLLAMAVFGGLRFGVRSIRDGRAGREKRTRGKRALVIGAGEAAEGLLRQVRRNESDKILPVALVDDDPAKRGMRLHGLRVEGTTEDIAQLAARHRIELLVLAMPSATRDQLKRIVDRCMDAGIDFRIVPTLEELVDGRARLNQLRSVEIEDLLGRSSVDLRLDLVELDLAGCTAVVTGGAGSIGAELVRQIARFRPQRLVIVDKAESPLYFIHLEMQQAYPQLDVVPVIMDITDEHGLGELFERHRPTHVFHAAAYKHVPLMEEHVSAAVRNNVFGTLALAACAARHGVAKFVLISTDKAVRPSSVMGATKRIAERIVLGWPALQGARTDFRAVRFGNVLGSDGSVVPLFKRQLAAGKPLTVTHPDVTRYFMTIPEAVQLVLQAAVIPEAAGRISMLEMGEPVRIVALAENLIRLSGLEPYHDVPIVFTGLRPGEKLHEELMSQIESTVATAVEKVHVVQTDEVDGLSLQFNLERLRVAIAEATREDLLRSLRALVPECVEPLRRAEWMTPLVTPMMPELAATPAKPGAASEAYAAAVHGNGTGNHSQRRAVERSPVGTQPGGQRGAPRVAV